ncbi:RNA polymerase II-associated protein [Achlya hypogyna]|uniref:RNA polymerase II-associated protein 3 n=1 Tax=Achlya hypogyna TaxID=1202772 RepID=A0A1V9Y5Y7_ACHHY|nr:RNA polymerase II-associated protein [Achlya hypogyna]
MDALAVQRQIRENASYLQDYYSDLKSWEKDIAKKEAAITGGAKKPAPRVRNAVAVNVRGSADSVSITHPLSRLQSPAHEAPTKAPPANHVYDKGYKKWESFDVEAALKEIDEPTPKTPEVAPLPAHVQRKSVPKAAPKPTSAASREVLEKEDGNTHFKAGEYMAAVKCYTRSLGYNPRNPVVLSNRAMAHLKLKEYLKAEQDTTLALQYDPVHVKSLARRATARNALGKHRLALRDAEAALALEPLNKTLQAQLKTTREAVKLAVKRASAHSVPVAIDIAPQEIVAAAPTSHEPVVVDIPTTAAAPPLQTRSIAPPKVKVKVPEKAPTTSYEFGRVWKSFRFAEEVLTLRRRYLDLVPVAALPKLFKDAIESDLLVEIVHALGTRVDASAVAFLEGLARVPRFDMVVRFLSNDERSAVATVLAEAEAVLQTSLPSLKAAYGI